MKTIKQLADELHTSKTSIRRKMTTEFKERYTKTVGNKIYINAQGEQLLKDSYNIDLLWEQNATEQNAPSAIKCATSGLGSSIHTETTTTENANMEHNKTERNAYINTLERELDIKNSQIDSLQQSVYELTTALVSAQKALEHSQSLHAGTIHQQITAAEEEPQKKSFWVNLFQKKQ